MKIWKPGRKRRNGAFTLAELMVASAVLIMAISGLISIHIMGLKIFELTKSKLGANQEARESLSKFVEDVRSAKIIQVGNGNQSVFNATEMGSYQQGNALRLFPTTNLLAYTQYFLDLEHRLIRLTSTNNIPEVMARCITNSIIFTAEDFNGNVLTNNQNNRVIGMLLQFYQIQYPIVTIGPGNLYDFYQLRTRVTRRTLE